MAWYLKKLSSRFHCRVEVLEVDIRNGKRYNLAQPKVQQRWLSFIRQGRAAALLVTPPCSTFSRAPWANDGGPFPLRSSQCLRGFPWNSPKRREKAELGNNLADFAYEAMEAQLLQGKPAVMEQPEDLGAPRRPRVPGHRPGSMWQFAQHRQLLDLPGVRSVALAQLDFGTPSPKPTRLLHLLPGDTHPCMYEGLPQLDDEGKYMGPLPKKQGEQLIGKVGSEFKTAASAAWPPSLCEWVATQFLTAFQMNRATGGGQDQEETRKRKCEETGKRTLEGKEGNGSEKIRKVEQGDPPVIDPSSPPVKGGTGRARECSWKGHKVAFHDGGCLLSPGRWDRKRRWHPTGERWDGFRKRLRTLVLEKAGGETNLERECFSMARGAQGCKLVQDEDLLQSLRSEMGVFIGSPEAADEISPGQPFRLELMKRVLEEAGDGDCGFLEEAKEGFVVGVLHPMPRTPAAFEQQVEWSLQDDPTGGYALEKKNYPSAGEHEEHLRAHLEGEVEEGLVERMTRGDFERTFGENRAISALAVLVEDELTGKKRVIHDGSHEVRVNHRIKCQDKLRMPGGREKRYLLAQFEEERAVAFSMIGDFGKAHRRFKYRRDEQGFLGCVVTSDDGWVYVNKVGTFGVASTPYWWGRLSGSLVRLAHYLLGPSVPLELLLYADDLEALGLGPEGRKGLVMVFCYLAALGSPFKWSKQRGGLVTEWIGLTTNYGSYAFGLSEKRSSWLVSWIDDLLKNKEIEPREFAAVVGRLSFSSTALPWEKPFLGPLYTWSAAIRDQRGKVVTPWAILIIMDWIGDRLRTGGRMEKVKKEEEMCEGPVIYTDARASDEDACLGGYLAVSEDLKECPWFSIDVDETLAPWLKVRSSPKRVIAALELLATIIAIKLWGHQIGKRSRAKMKAFTDNRGNAFALVRGMSTKFPLTVLLMELAEELRVEDRRMDLEWVRRDSNIEADELSNGNWSRFDPSRRAVFDPRIHKWKVLEKMQRKSQELYEELKKMKQEKSTAKLVSGRKTKKAKVLAKW